ncbi:Lipase [Bienertia sinuspersici]
MSNYISSSKDLICKDYLLLRPEKATFYDLLRLLVYNEKRKLIDCPLEFQQDLREFNYRWLVFISALLLKLFGLVKTPMAYIGYLIETVLNLITDYGGLLNLLLNFIKGNGVVMPNKSSEKYRSIMTLLDNRVDLDPTIQQGHVNYKASLAWMASKLSYENSAFTKNVVENHWKMKLIDTYSFRNDFQRDDSTHAFMLRNVSKEKDLIVVAFRGTNPFDADDWRADIDISWYGLSKVGRVHGGFMKALGLQTYDEDVVGWPNEIEMGNEKPQYAYYTIRHVLKNILKENKNAKFLLVGHSLGGALAILFASVLILHEEKELLDQLEGVYTFGQPRVGDEEFGDFMKKKLKAYNVDYYRYVYCNDMVPRLPYDDKTLLFKHFGPSLYYDSCYKGKELEEEPNKNYFSLWWVIPKYVNAGWELLRGFIFPYTIWGPDYKESWFERLFRVFGLVVPGLSAHGPQDYTNLTRLGRLSLPLDDKRFN